MSLRDYFIGAGDVHVSPLDENGDPTTWTSLEETPMLEFTPATEYADNFATGKTGPNQQDLHTAIKRSAGVTLVLKERNAYNLELIVHGESSEENAGTMSTPVNLDTGIADGDVIVLPGDHVGITSLVLKDSTGSPVTLDGDNYSFDGDSKLITFIDVSGLTQPIKVFSYSFAASRSTKLLSQTPSEVALLFDGINLAKPGEKVWMRIDRVAFSPGKMSMKAGGAGGTSSEADAPELSGVALLKPGNEQDDGYGVMKIY